VVETHGRAVLLKDNAPAYIIMKPDFLEHNNDILDSKRNNTSLTLHDAMRVVLQGAEGQEMHAKDLANEIFRRGLYLQKDGTPAKYNQIRARCNRYSEFFEAFPGNIIKLKSEAIILDLAKNDERGSPNMAKGEKYIEFTNYLMLQHSKGVEEFSLSFEEIDEISGNPFPPSTRRLPWGNTAGHSYSISWLRAGYVVRADLSLQRAYFTYNLRRANELLSRYE
jgi:antitoxin Phd